jgi:peptide/nickel transport system substrate-binding protein
MKSKRNVRIAVAALAAAGLVAGSFVPAQGATRSTVVLHEVNPLTGFNSSVTGYSLVTNSAVGYLSGAGFNYYDDKKNLVKNTVFGSYKVVKNATDDFRTQWTVNPGRVWSDGTPITGVDLLLSHMLSSNAYSIAAGLGDPKSKDNPPAFTTSGYSGIYNDNIVGEPVLSDDKMSVTLRFKKRIANWDLYGPGVSPVHTLILMSEGKKALGTVAENEAARSRFLDAFTTKNTTVLKAIAKVWSNDYNIADVTSSTNPLLFVGNGGFTVKSAVKNQSVTLTTNTKYNSGPAMTGSVDTVVFRFITDGNAASQALANGELDIYSGQATADGVAALRQIKNITILGGKGATYEHWDLRTNAFQGEPEYNGIFAAKFGQRSLDLRRAFLLGIPRTEILEKLIQPFAPDMPVLDSSFTTPGEDIYGQVVRANGSSYYRGSQDSLNKRALALVKKYYPDAPKTLVKVNVIVPGNNPRRAAEFALTQANMKKIGFDLVGDVKADWGSRLTLSQYDASFFGWSAGSVLQAKGSTIFRPSGTQNYAGWSIPTDRFYDALSSPLSRNVIAQNYISIERPFFEQALTLPVFQFPTVTAHNKDLKNVKPSPLNPNLVWNYWEWSY